MDWFSFEHRKCTEEEKEFIKKHIDTIVESDYPNKVLEGLRLFQAYQLHSVKLIQKPQEVANAFDVAPYLDTMIKHHCNNHIIVLGLFYKLLGPWTGDSFNKFLDLTSEQVETLAQHLLVLGKNPLLISSEYRNTKVITLKNLNRDNIIAFIEDPSLSLNAVTIPPKANKFDFTFLFALLKTLAKALIRKNSNSRSPITTIKVSINTFKNSRQQYKKYQEAHSKITETLQNNYKNDMSLLAREILDKEDKIKKEIDWKSVAYVLCELGQCYGLDTNLPKDNPVIAKLLKEYNCPDIDNSVKSKLEVISWLSASYYRNGEIVEKKFIKQHIAKVMDSVDPRGALNALYLIYFYKL